LEWNGIERDERKLDWILSPQLVLVYETS